MGICSPGASPPADGRSRRRTPLIVDHPSWGRKTDRWRSRATTFRPFMPSELDPVPHGGHRTGGDPRVHDAGVGFILPEPERGMEGLVRP